MHVLEVALQLVFASEAITATAFASDGRACMLGSLSIRTVLASIMALEIGPFLCDSVATCFGTDITPSLAKMVPLVLSVSPHGAWGKVLRSHMTSG